MASGARKSDVVDWYCFEPAVASPIRVLRTSHSMNTFRGTSPLSNYAKIHGTGLCCSTEHCAIRAVFRILWYESCK